VLLPAAEDGRHELADALAESGAHVTRVVAYRALKGGVSDEERALLRERPPRVVMFGSPRTAEAFLDTLGEDGRRLAEQARVVAIGPTTASALERLGLKVAAVAARPTAEALVDAAISAVQG
jgi:uroporphyrinogen-III synthase